MRDYSLVIRKLQEAGCGCIENEPMAAHTSFNIGGPADLFINAPNKDALKSALAILKNNNVPVFVLGNGSNLLVSDLGIEGAVIRMTGDFSTPKLISAVDIQCGAGAKLASLCSFALENSLSGMEFAWGIPGTVGGAAYMNAGAYDSMMSNVVSVCNHIDMDGNEGSFTIDQLEYDYRKSVYMGIDNIITDVSVHLNPSDPSAIRARMDELMYLRKSSSPWNIQARAAYLSALPDITQELWLINAG